MQSVFSGPVEPARDVREFRGHQLRATSACLAAIAALAGCSGSESTGGSTHSGGATGTAGATGGQTSRGGTSAAAGGSTVSSGTGGASGAGASPTGGAMTTGGVPTSGGNLTTGGANSRGGAGTGGAKASGGFTATGGTVASGGTTAGGGSKATGGTTSSGGAGTGGAKASGGSTASGGASGTGGTTNTGPAPCDIYASATTPCVAAHSTVRALFSSYDGKLYQIRNKSGTTKDILTLGPGGFADAASQDAFCSGTTCVLLYIYDQTGHGIDLTWQASDSPVGGKNTAATITTEKLTVSGHSVYSTYINAGQAYWSDGSKKGMPVGSAAETVYMVTSGTHTNDKCCFDYGNGETNRKVGGGGAMNALYFGKDCWFGNCSGTGPWVMIDPEGGLYPGTTSAWPSTQKAFPQTYVTAMMKNDGKSQMQLKGADATSGNLSTVFSGKPPTTPNQQGALTLGGGGDCCYSNTNMSQGTFYEGAIVSGYPSDATDDSVQANVVSLKYGK